MKKVSALLLVFLTTLSFAFAQGDMKRVSPHTTVESPSKNIKVVYGQPSKKGRVIFGPTGSAALEKYGKPWRTGADEATEITFKNDVMFGGKHVKAGTYTLVTFPGEKEWGVVLNSKLGQWGAYDYDKNVASNVVEVKVPAKMGKDVMEKLVITPTDKDVTIAWDQAMITVPVMEHKM